MSLLDIYIKHNDWEGTCFFKDNKIYRKCNIEEYGNYNIKNNILTIYWEKWNTELFYSFDNQYYYSKELFNNKYNNYTFIEKNCIFKVVLEKNNNKSLLIKNKEYLYSNYELIDDSILLIIYNKKYKYYNNNNNYIYENDYKLFFNLMITIDNIEEEYIFNKILKTFYNNNNFENYGTYEINNNNINMVWNNGTKKEVFSNKYNSINNNENIVLIKPIKVIFSNKLIFSNISLCKNKIIFTSIHYKENPINYDEISIIINDYHKKFDKITYDNDDYESSSNIIITLDREYQYINLVIKYKNYKKKVKLEQLNIQEHFISAMTLFKDDIDLLKRYLKYYSQLGIEIFYLYYNKKFDHAIIQKIINLNENNCKIYLIEWDYIYMMKYGDLKHHFAQTMAINDSLNILKNYGSYTLYNDLDEYLIIDKKLNLIINENDSIDIFIFKNRFVKMGNELISYEDFDSKFNLNNIIKGNYWDNMREKNLIKLKNINVMGVHKYFSKFNNNNNNINQKVIGEFYHIINFKEKYRELLMTTYTTDI